MKSGYIFIDNMVFSSLLAISQEEQSRGLMFEPSPAPIMSFVYANPQINKFWMKNTEAPLDIIFCHAGEVSQICQGTPYSTQVIGDDKLSDLIIEMPQGMADAMVIKLGHKVGLVKPTMTELKEIICKKDRQL